jgi:hypothetical protein
MKRSTSWLAVLFFLLSAAQVVAQEQSDAIQDRGARLSPKSAETVVRQAYAKLARYNKAARLQEMAGGSETLAETVALQFQLSDFRTGPISEILPLAQSDLLTFPTGEIITGITNSFRQSGGDEQVTYDATWRPGQYAAGNDPRWTIGQVLALTPDRYDDLSDYASYQVTVSLDGKARTYRAAAVFHDAGPDGRHPEFWDAVVGMGGTLTRFWEEQRAPLAPPAPEAVADETSVGHSRLKVGTRDAADQFTEWFFKYDEDPDALHHASGDHAVTSEFQLQCLAQPNNKQLCTIAARFQSAFDYGVLDDAFGLWYHASAGKSAGNDGVGNRGTDVNCNRVFGGAFSECLIFFTCTIPISVSIQPFGIGLGVNTTGGDLWNSGVGLQGTCHLQSTGGTSSNCTTPGFNGSCPPGTSYNSSNGLCCSTQANQCSTTFANKCLMYGGDYDFFSCTCDGCAACGGSPIMIDVAGDGIALTNVEGGVQFDLNGDGVTEPIPWIAAGADDAFLALDRNGNGRIDNGKELFGNFTDQPVTTTPNGYIALAEFDKPANGGNGDGVIDAHDAVFASLRLWQDTSHDGVSQPSELHTLNELGIKTLHLDYKLSKKTDSHGNEFRYRAKVDDVKGSNVARWSWDVFFTMD